MPKLGYSVLIFLLAALALWSFEDAVFTPLKSFLSEVLGGYTSILILAVCSVLLLVVFKKRLPFTEEA